MGNVATSLGDSMSCFRTHQNASSVQANLTSGKDLDDAVLAAVNNSLDAAASGLTNTVSISFKCKNLPNMDTFTRTDGMVVLYKKVGSNFQRLGMTEVVMDSLDPVWVKSFDVQYNFEIRESYKVEVYDIDDHTNLNNFAGHDYVGGLEFTLHEVVTAREQCFERPLVNQKLGEGKAGLIQISGEEKTRAAGEEIVFRPRARLSSSVGMCFIMVMKNISHTNWKPIYKSEIKPAQNGTF